MKEELKFTGKSGCIYKFHIYPWPSCFTINDGAIFLFVRFLHDNFFVPIFLGITQNLKTRFLTERMLRRINKNDPTHIGICIEDDESKRLFAQEDLAEIAETQLDLQTR